MLNRVVLIGRLTQDPELRHTHSGTAVASFSLAVDRPRANQNGERETDFIQIVVWQKLAELCAEYLKRGRLQQSMAGFRFERMRIKKDKRFGWPRWSPNRSDF